MLGSANLRGTFRRISQLWDNAHTSNLENCLLYLSSIISQFLDFTHWIVFDFIFHCVTMHTLYTTRTSPRLVRSTKLSPVPQGWYLDGWPNTNTPCCNINFSFFSFVFFLPFSITKTAELPALCSVVSSTYGPRRRQNLDRTGSRIESRTGSGTGSWIGSRTGSWIGSRKKIQNSRFKIQNFVEQITLEWLVWAERFI